MPYLAHATMEPMNATAYVSKGKCEIWAPTQSQDAAVATAKMITGFDAADILVHTTYLGGGFGRRYYQDFIRDAVEISKEMGKPVKVVYSRSDDIKNDFYRPMSVHRMQATLKADKMIDIWSHDIAAPSILQAGMSEIMGPSLPGFIPAVVKSWMMHGAGLALNVFDDPTSVQGAADLAYTVGERKTSYRKTESPLPIGFWRSVGHSANGFVVESFVDELAERAGADPLEFRLRHLKDNRRLLDLAQLVGDKSKWGSTTGAGIARGFAMHPYHNTWVAQVVEVSLEPTFRVHRVFAAIDCGLIVNPAQVEAQVRSGIVYGLSAALYGKIQFENGQIKQSNFHDYPVLRYGDMPSIEVFLMPSSEQPLGVGEASTPSIAPAITNALYRLTKNRIRKLPIADQLVGI